MQHDLECPYCGHDIEICNDDGHGCSEDEIYQEQCPACEKIFTFTTYIVFSYEASKSDCLNGGEHKLHKIHGFPEELYKNMYRCSDCGEEIDKYPEDSKRAREEYNKKFDK